MIKRILPSYPKLILLLAAGAWSGALASQALNVTLDATNVLCFGQKSGSISTVVTGGTPPYAYKWSTGETTISITGLAAGYYNVEVKDAEEATVKVEVTLTEPEQLRVERTLSTFPNGHNISCFECSNGYILVEPTEGTPPYSYAWDDGLAVSQNRYGLGPKTYEVTVTDANGCQKTHNATITQPERSDWTMNGNTGTNPATQYIGTSDNKAVVFKANGQESLRLEPDGKIKLLGTSTASGLLWRRADGALDVRFPYYPPVPSGSCLPLADMPFWLTQGNDFTDICEPENPRLGTIDHRPLRLITNNTEKVHIAVDGSVGVGTATPEAKLHVMGGLFFKNPFGDVLSRTSEAEGMGLWVRNFQAAWGLSIAPDGTGHILGNWSNPQPAMSFNYDRVTVTSRLVVGEPEFGPFGLYKVLVDGGVACRDVLVKTGAFPDYVFQPNYALMPLGDLRAYLRENSHLPGIPSAAEVEEKGGVEVGDLQVRMLRALEEQALYILQLEERLKAAEQRLSTLNTGK